MRKWLLRQWRKWRYARYLRSPGWQQRRGRVLARAGYRCEHCGARVKLDVHHLTYARRGREELTDLVALCRACHRREHAEVRFER
jgi:5-methylcytosine-specific restriction endonuclease McrA